MKFIEKVILKNFQSHKYTEIDFKLGLNVIVGPSDSGKTSILRAMKWVLYNEPMGDFFIREGENECRVSLVFSDGIIVERLRTRSKNQYRIIDNLGEITIYEGFGHDVPLEVIEATGISKVSLDSDEDRILNLSEQLDGAFLLSERDAVKASSIGRLVGVNIIDDALRISLRDRNELNSKKKIYEEEKNTLIEELKKYDYIEDYKKQIDLLEDISNELKNKREKLNELNEKNIKLNKIYREVEKYYKILKELNKLEDSIRLTDLIELKIYNYNRLIKVKDKLAKLKVDYIETNNQLKKLKNIDEIEIVSKKLNKQINTINRLNLSNEKLLINNKNISKYQELANKLKDIDNTIKQKGILERKIEKYNNIKSINYKYLDTEARIEKGIRYTNLFKNVDTAYKNQLILEKKNKKLKYLLEKNIKLKRINQELKEGNEIKIKIIKNGEQYLNQYKELLKKHKKCPYCNSNIDDEHLKNIEKELWI